jgi:hypothetical protein
MSDVCIIGIGIHPFGRTDGMSGAEQGVYAVRQALADAGVDWRDVQFAYGGSDAAGNPDTMVEALGLTGVQFINVKNGCATGGSALFSAQMAIKSGEFDLGLAIGFDKHPRGAFNALPAEYNLPEWYGEAGYMIITCTSTAFRRPALAGWRKRLSATPSTHPMPGGASRWRSRRSCRHLWSAIPIPNSCSARPQRAVSRWCWRARRRRAN